jgi:hypothetical protein
VSDNSKREPSKLFQSTEANNMIRTSRIKVFFLLTVGAAFGYAAATAQWPSVPAAAGAPVKPDVEIVTESTADAAPNTNPPSCTQGDNRESLISGGNARQVRFTAYQRVKSDGGKKPNILIIWEFPRNLGALVVSSVQPGGSHRVTNSRPLAAHSSAGGANRTSATEVPPSEGNEARRDGRQEVVAL